MQYEDSKNPTLKFKLELRMSDCFALHEIIDEEYFLGCYG